MFHSVVKTQVEYHVKLCVCVCVCVCVSCLCLPLSLSRLCFPFFLRLPFVLFIASSLSLSVFPSY